MTNLYVALIHYPVVNKHGKVITSAVTNLDIHDISRAVKTFGVRSFYIVTPLEDQRVLADRIVSYWVKGAGASYNPKRNEALKMISIRPSLEDVIEDVFSVSGKRPEIVATCAKQQSRGLSYRAFQQCLKSGNPYLLVFGTAWGLSETFLADADFILDPISGSAEYNHLSVRSAAAVILDRLMREETV